MGKRPKKLLHHVREATDSSTTRDVPNRPMSPGSSASFCSTTDATHGIWGALKSRPSSPGAAKGRNLAFVLLRTRTLRSGQALARCWTAARSLPVGSTSTSRCRASSTPPSWRRWPRDRSLREDAETRGRTIAVGETGGKLIDERLSEPSASIRTRIERAHESQRRRFDGARGDLPLLCNADTSAPAAQTVSSRRTRGPNGMQVWARPRCASTASWTTPARACSSPAIGLAGVRSAMQQLGMSARAFHRTAERQAGTHDCRPGRRGGDQDASSGGGDPIQATQAKLPCVPRSALRMGLTRTQTVVQLQ